MTGDLLRFVMGFVFLFLFAHATHAALPSDFSALYVFGDSLSDIGNYKTKISNCLQTGGTSAPVTNQEGGEFPGKLWVNFLSEDFGFIPKPGSLKHPEGNDWAVAGALTIDIVTQIENYLATNEVDKNALYAIWIGSNDIGFRLDPSNQIPNHPVTPQQVVIQGTMNIFAGIAELYNHGARQFLVIGVPDASLTPGVFFEAQKNPSLTAQVHAICQGWNQALFDHDASTPGRAPLEYLKKLYPDIKIFVWNPTPLFDAATGDPEKFGFQNEINGVPNNHTVWCMLNETKNPDDFIFFNGLHPTAHAHQVITENILKNAELF